MSETLKITRETVEAEYAAIKSMQETLRIKANQFEKLALFLVADGKEAWLPKEPERPRISARCEWRMAQGRCRAPVKVNVADKGYCSKHQGRVLSPKYRGVR